MSEGVDDVVDRIANHPSVEWVEPLHKRTTQVVTPNDPSYTTQYALNIVEAAKAWGIVPGSYLSSLNVGSKRVRIAIIDTGADCTHPEFKNGGTTTSSAGGGQLAAGVGMAFVPTRRPSPACIYQDDHGHGTHVAGIIAASTNNTTGIASLGYAAELMIIKALDSMGFGNDAVIADAIVDAVDGGSQIISLSLGGSGYSQALQDAMRYAWQRGVLVISAAGNYNSQALFYPAASNYTIAVAATDAANAKASFSNWGNWIGISAPGVNIYSTLPTYDLGDGKVNYGTMSGTSMATPIVSALAGLIQMASPELSVTGILQQIQKTAASPSAGGGWDNKFGYGVINAYNAVSGTYRPAVYGSIRGQVTNVAGTPVAGAQVSAGSVTFTTASDGLFRLANLTSGNYTVSITAAAYTAASRIAVVSPGADTPLAVRLGETVGTYKGTVKSAGVPVAGAVVEAVSGGLVQTAVITSATGQYTLQVPAGAYTLRASAFGHGTTGTAVANMTGTATITANLQLDSLGLVTGRVQDTSGSPIANAQVQVQAGEHRVGGVTDSAGIYTTPGLPAANYLVTASAPSGSASEGPLTVANGSVVPVNFTLTGATINLSPSMVAADSGKAVQFTASGSGLPVSWSTSPATGSITTTGKYTAPSTTAASTVTIKASSVANPASVGTATVFVNGRITLTLGSSQVIGGNTINNCQLSLSSPAPPGGVVVSLASSRPEVVNPIPSISITATPTIAIAAGSTTSGMFAIATSTVTGNTNVTLTATAAGMTTSVPVQVRVTELNGVALGQTQVEGGADALSNVIWLMGPAPAGGAVVKVQSNDTAAATVPANVTIAAGTTGSPTFIIKTSPVTATKVVRITATLNGTSKYADLTLTPGGLAGMTVSPTIIRGGAVTSNNTVTISSTAGTGGVVVKLSSNKTAVASVPASVTIPKGSKATTFAITTSAVAVNTDVVITAGSGSGTVSKTITVRPPALTSMVVASINIAGGIVAKSNRVTLEGPAPKGGVTVLLSSSHPALAPVPASILVPEGQNVSTYFDIPTSPVPAATEVTITATASGVTKSDKLILRLPFVSSLVVYPVSVVGPVAATACKVNLDGPAPAGGARVMLTSSHPAVAQAPVSIVVPAGESSSANFTVDAKEVTATITATVTAAYNGSSKTDTLVVRPAVLASLAIGPAALKSGASHSSNRAMLDGGAPAAGARIVLTSSHPALVEIPSSITVVPGEKYSPYFPVTAKATAAPVTVTISATYQGVVKTDTLIINP